MPTSDVRLGDCRAVMAAMAPNSVDAIVTDPPYGINFMGKAWDGKAIAESAARDAVGRARTGCGVRSDNGRGRTFSAFGNSAGEAGRYNFSADGNHAFQEWCESWAREAHRVLRPGGHLLAFGGTRTFHRLACALEDAGFEIRDTLSWLYGSGFPKSLNIGGGFGTALKPAWEPIILARKPLSGTVAANVAAHGTGALNIDGCRIGMADDDATARQSRNGDTKQNISGYGHDTWGARDFSQAMNTLGRWPANVVIDEAAAVLLDEQSGVLHGHGSKRHHGSDKGLFPWGTADRPQSGGDTGGASRFFYVAKASRTERNAGLDGMPERTREQQYRNVQDGRPHTSPDYVYPDKPVANHHPTVKPIALMRWLCRLICPPNGTILDPFMGSGTTGCAAALEGVHFIGIEQDADYLAIAERRIAHWTAQACCRTQQLELAAD